MECPRCNSNKNVRWLGDDTTKCFNCGYVGTDPSFEVCDECKHLTKENAEWVQKTVDQARRADAVEKENEALKAEVYKIRGELATTRAENLAMAMKLTKLESKDSTLHFNHKEG